jgi:ketosteroid isomerase-like protein
MQKPHITISFILTGFFVLYCNSILTAQTTAPDTVLSPAELQKAGTIVEAISKQFSKDFLDADSVALAAYYAKDAHFGSVKGKNILSAWSSLIQYSIKNDARNLIFTTTGFTGDSEYLVELGVYEMKDDNNNIKDNGKYVVVWKQENGKWKIYRDWGL